MLQKLFDSIEDSNSEIETIEEYKEIDTPSQINYINTNESINTDIIFNSDECKFLINLIDLYQKLCTLKLSNTIKPFIFEQNIQYEIDIETINYHLKQVRNLLISNSSDYKQFKNDLSDWSLSEKTIKQENLNLIKNLLDKLK